MRMNRYILPILLFALIGLASCRPDGILSQRKMQNVLHDLHYAEGVLQEANMNFGHDDTMAKYYGQVLAKHGVTQAQFDSSLVWYTHNPKRFAHIYPKVIARLQAESEALQAEIKRRQGRPTITPEESQHWTDSTLVRYINGLKIENDAYGWVSSRRTELSSQER